MMSERDLKPFTFKDIQGKIIASESSVNLDNFDNESRTQTAVQMTREMTTTNGCRVTMVFPRESRPGVRRRIAEMFLAAMEKGTEKP